LPAIAPAIRKLVTDARLSGDDVAKLREQVDAGAISPADVKKLATCYADALEAGAGTKLFALLDDIGAGTIDAAAPIQDLSAAPALLNGLLRLPQAGRKHEAVPTVQRALMALASRTGEPAFMLPKYGVDGDYGEETRAAVKAFQDKHGLPATGDLDLHTAQRLEQQLKQTRVPAIFVGGSTPVRPSNATMVAAALDLIDKRADNFGVPNAWWNIDSRHALPANVKLGGLKGTWKCNLFAGNSMVAAGFEPPYYDNAGRGEYPNANQFYKWSDKYAARYGNQDHVRFTLRDELEVQALSGDARRDAVIELLNKAEPGDMIFVDHVGDLISDGGHCRVVVEEFDEDAGTLASAQAREDSAKIVHDTISKFASEETIWLVRPIMKRPEGPAAIT
jgi:peptidoglycan hydrolase-like protein with peptidoglycan-binding domain